jgi:hypothetical protein
MFTGCKSFSCLVTDSWQIAARKLLRFAQYESIYPGLKSTFRTGYMQQPGLTVLLLPVRVKRRQARVGSNADRVSSRQALAEHLP